MRILLVSDLHFALPGFDWVRSVAGDYDAVVLAGDHVDIASSVDIDTQIVALRATLADLATQAPLFVCSGNHDLNTRDDSGEKTADWLAPLRDAGAAVDGDTVEMDGTVFTVVGWWDGPVARARVERQLAAADPGGRPWVWVYHSPPRGPLSWTGSRHYGDPVVAGWIERWSPALVLTGHIHQAPFTDDGSWIARLGATWLFNAGKQPGPVPSHVVIDLERRTARWRSFEGTEERRLTPVAGQ